jgi:hypothetical protein
MAAESFALMRDAASDEGRSERAMAAYEGYVTSGLIFMGQQKYVDGIESFKSARDIALSTGFNPLLAAVAFEGLAAAYRANALELCSTQMSGKHSHESRKNFSYAGRKWLDIARSEERMRRYGRFQEAAYIAQCDACFAADFDLLADAYDVSAQYYLDKKDFQRHEMYRVRRMWALACGLKDLEPVKEWLADRMGQRSPAGSLLEAVHSAVTFYCRAVDHYKRSRTELGINLDASEELALAIVGLGVYGDEEGERNSGVRRAFLDRSYTDQLSIAEKVAKRLLGELASLRSAPRDVVYDALGNELGVS